MKPSYIDILPQTAKKSISRTNNDNASTISDFKPRKRTNAYWQKRSKRRNSYPLSQQLRMIQWLYEAWCPSD